MLALSVVPGAAGSARIEDVAEPDPAEGPILVKTRAIGVCGTDLDIVSGAYGCAPPGEGRLIIGHESLGVVEAAPRGAALAAGDLVVGIVRRPDPVPCASCAAGEWDMCRNGLYTERGIRKRHGYGAERFRLAPEFAVKVDPALGLRGVLLEPASVVAKAWEQVDRIGRRGIWNPATALVTGAGSVGLLAALMGVADDLDVKSFAMKGQAFFNLDKGRIVYQSINLEVGALMREADGRVNGVEAVGKVTYDEKNPSLSRQELDQRSITPD